MINLDAAFQFPLTSREKFGDKIAEFDWEVPEQVPYFEGHFPGRPILPAIAVLDANSWLLQKIFSPQLQVKSLLSAKFAAPIEPKMSLKIRIEKREDETFECKWQEKMADDSLRTVAYMIVAAV